MKKILTTSALLAITAFAMISCKGGSDGPKVDVPEGMTSLCGTSTLIGTKESSISNGACNIANPVKVYYVNGIKLSAPALINCQAATTLAGWVQNSLQPEAKKIGKSVTDIYVMASYSCRPRNNKSGAKLSEHGYGNAIDIGGFTFDDGTKTVILNDYYGNAYKGFLSRTEAGACGPFGTVLGPKFNAQHKNHFHFDVASYSMGAYCK